MKQTIGALKIVVFMIVLSKAFTNQVYAQDAPQLAGQILKEASEQAAKENKNVFVIFHASWCVWCHRMDSLMNTPQCKDLFAKNYVIKHLVVLESSKKKNLENPGALDLLAQYNGDKAGIPFWLIFDKNGKLLADAQERAAGDGLDKPGKNTGCPTTPDEITHFIKVLKQTSALNSNQLAVIEKQFAEK